MDIGAEHKVCDHNQVDTLYYQTIGDITLMHGTVQLNTHNHDQEARYHRDVLFINGPDPYLVDLNTVKTTKGSWDKYDMSYFGNGRTFNGSGRPFSVNANWNDWTDPINPHPDGGNLKLYGFIRPVELYNPVVTPFMTSEQLYNSGPHDSTVAVYVSNGNYNQGFTTVGIFQAASQPDPVLCAPAYLYLFRTQNPLSSMVLAQGRQHDRCGYQTFLYRQRTYGYSFHTI